MKSHADALAHYKAALLGYLAVVPDKLVQILGHGDHPFSLPNGLQLSCDVLLDVDLRGHASVVVRLLCEEWVGLEFGLDDVVDEERFVGARSEPPFALLGPPVRFSGVSVEKAVSGSLAGGNAHFGVGQINVFWSPWLLCKHIVATLLAHGVQHLALGPLAALLNKGFG